MGALFKAFEENLQRQIQAEVARAGYQRPGDIPEDMTFRQWCEDLAEKGLVVDRAPFSLADRRALNFIYDLIPTTIEEAYNKIIVLMKGAQMGLTIWEMLADIYMGLKFAPLTVGMYVPAQGTAGLKSTNRFMPVVRSIPAAIDNMRDEKGNRSEGNVLSRQIGESWFVFLWTTSKTATESIPMDVLSFDEVQQMTVEQMERTRERLSASKYKFCLMLSTAMYPEADIHHWYLKGTQHQFHTHCEHCGFDFPIISSGADDPYFPDLIKYNGGDLAGAPVGYVYTCPECGGYIEDPQQGEWIALHPERAQRDDGGVRIISAHLPQVLSPTVSALDMIEAYGGADDMQNFYNRKLGKPFADPSRFPVTLEQLMECGRQGAAYGLKWELSGKECFMGIDQMGAFNCAIIKRRLPDGRQAVVHAEAIYDDDPFARCDKLMEDYRVDVCVVEMLPNYNDAKRFAKRHLGRVFVCSGYGDMDNGMIKWGDVTESKADRRTDEQERDRYTVRADQYKCMQVSMARLAEIKCLFPDPKGLIATYFEHGQTRGKKVTGPICKDVLFLHFTKVALIVEKDEVQKKYRRRVEKVGIDPHFAYANMLCDIAWARSHGTTTFFFPEKTPQEKAVEKVKVNLPGLPAHIAAQINELPSGDVCGCCEACDKENLRCRERKLIVKLTDPGCLLFVRDPYLSSD